MDTNNIINNNTPYDIKELRSNPDGMLGGILEICIKNNEINTIDRNLMTNKIIIKNNTIKTITPAKRTIKRIVKVNIPKI